MRKLLKILFFISISIIAICLISKIFFPIFLLDILFGVSLLVASGCGIWSIFLNTKEQEEFIKRMVKYNCKNGRSAGLVLY